MSNAKKTHAEFLNYTKELDFKELEKNDELKLEVVIEITDKLRHDFGHLAEFIDNETGNKFFGRPCLDSVTCFDPEDYKGTEEDAEVLEHIQGVMQSVSLSLAFLKYDGEQDEHSNINCEHVKRMKGHDCEVYAHADAAGDEVMVTIYIETGTMLVQL